MTRTLVAFSCGLSLLTEAQTVKLFTAGTTASFRGLSVLDDKTVWVSGSDGTLGKSTNGGTTWKWTTVKGFETVDFRDIEVFTTLKVVIMGVGSPAYILKSVDGGETWTVAFENKNKEMFLDALDFSDEENGIVIGDSLNGRFFMARTFDGGSSWEDFSVNDRPAADSGESCFAASGTNVRMLNHRDFVFVSGGSRTRFFRGNVWTDLPFPKGRESTGAFSVAAKNAKTMIVVGGDYKLKDSRAENCFISTDAGKTFVPPVAGPHGHRGCVEYLGKTTWISCGENGIDYSTDEGEHWNWISKEGFFVCRKAKRGEAVFFAGQSGRIGKLE